MWQNIQKSGIDFIARSYAMLLIGIATIFYHNILVLSRAFDSFLW